MCIRLYIRNSLLTSVYMSLEMLEVKFIAKVVTMGVDRLVIAIPKEKYKEAKPLKGKHVKVFLQEVTLEDE